MHNTGASLAWTPPAGWPTPPQGWAPGLGWEPNPDWPAVPAGHQWWQPTQRGLRRRRTAIALVGLSTAPGLLYGAYRIVALTLQEHALHARHSWHQPHSIAIEMTLFFVWMCSIALLIPASSIGASELLGQDKSGRARAAAFVALLCAGAVAQYVADLQADNSRFSPFARDAWRHDGRSWLALACLLAIVVFAGATKLLKSAGGSRVV